MNQNKRRTVRKQEFNLALNAAILVSERLDQSLPCATSLTLVATMVSKQLVLKFTDPVRVFNSSWSCVIASCCFTRWLFKWVTYQRKCQRTVTSYTETMYLGPLILD